MDIETILFSLLLILLAARIFGELANYFGAPAVIGELVAGIIIGPSLLGLVEMSHTIELLGEIGVILLLFEVGLETDVDKLIKTGRKAIVVAIGGFITPFALGFAASYWFFNLPLIVSLFIGGTLTATSIGITVRTLADMHRHNSREGQITLGAAVLDDILGVILLALLYEFSVKGEVNMINAARVLIFVCAFFLVAPFLARLLSKFIQFLDRRVENPGLIPTMMVSLVLFFAWLAHVFGAPELLGSFAAGLALSRRFFLPFASALKKELDQVDGESSAEKALADSPASSDLSSKMQNTFKSALHNDNRFSHKVESQLKPIVQLFTPIFFVSVGLSLELHTIDWTSLFFWAFSSCLIVIAVISKFAGALLIQESRQRQVIIGLAMIPRGEVGLIFAGLGASTAIFTGDVYTGLILVIAFTTLIAPFLIRLSYTRFGTALV
ncbi:Na(+)/H(+)-K(+) antiporter GerN [Thalassocella blandensis]|nr:Na(+)/H(+)-K(+) antiporter GerN [Thalassocella blandensis]